MKSGATNVYSELQIGHKNAVGILQNENGSQVIVDAHSDYDIVLKALKSRGYAIEGMEHLYSKDAIDIILTKDLTKRQNIITSIDDALVKIIEQTRLMIEKIMLIILCRKAKGDR